MRTLLLLLLIVPLTALSQIYRYTLPDGSIHYSDKPVSGAKKIKLRPIQSYKSRPMPVSDQSEATEKVKYQLSHRYTQFNIVSPAPNESIWNGIGLIDVIFNIAPSLAKGDKLVFIFDGKVIAESRSENRFTLNNVVRGSHHLQIKIVNQNGQTVQETERRIFYMHRPRVNMTAIPAKDKPLIPLNRPAIPLQPPEE